MFKSHNELICIGESVGPCAVAVRQESDVIAKVGMSTNPTR